MKLFLVVSAFSIVAHVAGKKYLIKTADEGKGSNRRRAADSQSFSEFLRDGSIQAGAGWADKREGKAEPGRAGVYSAEVPEYAPGTGALFTKIGDGSDLPECQDDEIEDNPHGIEECWKVSLDVDALHKLRPNDEVQFTDQEPAFKIKMVEDPVPLVYHVGKDSEEEEEPYGSSEIPDFVGGFVDGEITFGVLEVAAIAAKKLAGVSAVSNHCNHTELLEVMDVASQRGSGYGDGGTYYQLTLKLNTKSGPNCENLDTRVCSNIVARKSLPHYGHYCLVPDESDQCIGIIRSTSAQLETAPLLLPAFGRTEEITCTADGANVQGSGATLTAFNGAFTGVDTGLGTNLLVAKYPDGGIDVSGTARWKYKVFTVKPCSGKDCIVMYWRKPLRPWLDLPEIRPALLRPKFVPKFRPDLPIPQLRPY